MHPVSRALLALLLVVTSGAAHAESRESSTQHILLFFRGTLSDDGEVAQVRGLVSRAAAHGYTGIVLGVARGRPQVDAESYARRLRTIRGACQEANMDVIAYTSNLGYGGGILDYDAHLAAALPLRGVPFVAREGQLVHEPDAHAFIVNGGFERHRGSRVEGFVFNERPGKVSFVDRDKPREGDVSLRFQDFDKALERNARVMQRVTVQPYRCYRVSAWFRSEQLDPPRLEIRVVDDEGRTIMRRGAGLSATQPWTRAVATFNSLDARRVRVYCGLWNGDKGRFWLDDVRIEDGGATNLLRRPGTPVTVTDWQSGREYDPVSDYTVQGTPEFVSASGVAPVVRIPAGSAIGDGVRVVIDGYQALPLANGQMAVCMSEPGVYDILGEELRFLKRHLDPDGYFIAFDEVRHGGWCERCERRGLSAAQLIGDCVSRHAALIRDTDPHASIFVWSDMFDPAHNAREHYYLMKGDLRGSWRYIPNDLIVVCWYYDRRSRSLRHFADHGFRTVAAAYYDAGALTETVGWLNSLADTPSASGIMYTTWRGDYRLVEAFGDLVRGGR